MLTVKELREALSHLPDDHTVVVNIPNAPGTSPDAMRRIAESYWVPKSEWFVLEVHL